MIPRDARDTLLRLAPGFPVLLVTGPRQAGKTTLARATFPDKPYVSLEQPDEREFAAADPRAFLARYPEGAVLDEIQRAPELLSWLQGLVDERRQMGQWVLTGSAQLDLVAGVTQSLAGRVGRVELLPLSAGELARVDRLPATLEDALWRGGYPPLFDREVAPGDWFSNYMATYVERDVRQLLGIRDLVQFQRFVRLCAARSGQLLNLAALGADAGIAAVTAREWLSVLETSYLVLRLAPYHTNFGKRLVKTPKLYFLDVGLMAWLLGVREPGTLVTHPARGALFETWVVSELVKRRFHAGEALNMHFWRDHVGHEVDMLVEDPEGLTPIEVKSGTTFASDWPDALHRWRAQAGAAGCEPMVVYGGEGDHVRQGCRVLGWRAFAGSRRV
jgi:hypothetical protein